MAERMTVWPQRLATCRSMLLLAIVVACCGCAPEEPVGTGPASRLLGARAPLATKSSRLPRRYYITTRQAEAGVRYDIVPTESGGALARNPAWHFVVELLEGGVELRSGSATLGWRWTGLGREGDIRLVGEEVDHQIADNRLTLTRTSGAEWYLNGPLGLEQGFELVERHCPSQALSQQTPSTQ